MKNIRIHLAEDDEEDREFFMDALGELPIPTIIKQFTNGIELMDDLFSNRPLPEVIFLDLHMPHMDGFDCLMDIRSFEKFNAITIIVYSSNYVEREVNQLKSDGANGYIQKPSSFNILKTLLYQSLQNISNSDDLVTPPKFDIRK